MLVLIIAIFIVGLAVFLLSFNIIFRHKPFPSGDVGANPELRKRGLQCATSEEMKLWGKKGCTTHNHVCVGDCGKVIDKIREDLLKEQEKEK